MAEGSMETLVLSQLEILYKLGILDRSSNDDIQHQCTTSERGRKKKQQDAFLAALPPPSVTCPLSSGTFQDSVNCFKFDREPCRDEMSPHTMAILRQRRQHESWQRPCLNSSLNSSSSSVSFPNCWSSKQARCTLRTWLRHWKRFVMHRREKSRRLAVVNVLSKQLCLNKWAFFLKQQRYRHKKTQELIIWKVIRALSKWTRWKHRCSLLHGLLKGGRDSFVGRLIQKHVWRRWIIFMKQKQYFNSVLVRQKLHSQHRLVHSVWTKLRIHAFQGRQESLLLSKCLVAMQTFCNVSREKRNKCLEYHLRVTYGRSRRLLDRWRAYTQASCRDRRLSWGVQYNVSRRRFLLLWFKVARDTNYVHHLRIKVLSRMLCHHYQAWSVTVKAIKIGGHVRKTRETHCRKHFFQVFKDQVRLSVHRTHVESMIRHRRLAAAVEWLSVWVLERRRIRDAVNRICKRCQMRHLRSVWVAWWWTIRRRTLTLNQVEALRLRLYRRQIFNGLRNYYNFRLGHGQRLVKAQLHYRLHLLQRGIRKFCIATYQTAQRPLQLSHFRQKLRISLKKRHFCAWFSRTRSRKNISERLRTNFDNKSLSFSLNRRTWNRWVKFVAQCRRRSQCKHRCTMRKKRQVLHQWHRQASLLSRWRHRLWEKRKRMIRALFIHWHCSVEKSKSVRVIAEKYHTKKLCTRVLCEWRSRSSCFHRVRLHGNSIRCKYEKTLMFKELFEWRNKVRVRQCVYRLQRNRAFQTVRICYTKWSNFYALQKSRAKKLHFFRQVYGMHPTSSIVWRVWRHWQRTYRQNKCLRGLNRNLHLHQIRRRWLHWKDLYTAWSTLQVWRQAASAISIKNKRLGMRSRCFRESSLRRLQRWIMDEWKSLVEGRRSVQKRQSLNKLKALDELKKATREFKQAEWFHLKIWFRRWFMAYIKDSAVARRHFSSRLCVKVISLWWKASVHIKQEKVLEYARQTQHNLSSYHPQHHPFVNKAKRTDCGKNRRNTVSVKRENTAVAKNPRVESMQQMRRMLDPKEHSNYLKSYHESDQEKVKNEKCKRVVRVASAALGHSAVVTSSHRRLHSEQCKQNRQYQKDELIGGKCMRQSKANTKSCLNKLMAGSSKPQQEKMPASSNGVNLDPQIVNIIAVNRKDQESAPSLSRRRLRLNDCGNELPLFDSDMLDTGASTLETARIAIVEALDPVVQSEQSVTSHKCHPYDQINDTFHPSASSRPGQVRFQANTDEHEVQVSESDTQRVPHSLLSLHAISKDKNVDYRLKSRVGKTHSIARNKQMKVINSSGDEARPLAEILNLNSGTKASSSQYSGAHNQDRHSCKWNASMGEKIFNFYADSIIASASTSLKVYSARIRGCYRLTRDLALFQNDFYIDEFIKVYDASYEDESIEAEQTNLEHFLKQLIKSHPAYRKYLFVNSQETSAEFITPLDWLAQYRLQSHLEQRKRASNRPIKSTSFWIWSSMPPEMDATLETLFSVIKKYMRVLGQFFLRQAVQSSLPAKNNPQDFRMTSSAFINLMKQVQVFPQLFHRRELEDAVRLSCCSSPDTEELNFPEFIETLVRCSCNLRWGELDEGKKVDKIQSDDVVVSIKFVMLIFAMEGQGSVLRKRNDDVSAILGFMGQQQKKSQAQKLFRFHKMLASNKRRTSKANPVPSVWNNVRLQYSPMHSSTNFVPLSQDTFDELTGSWDKSFRSHVPTENHIHLNKPYKSSPLAIDTERHGSSIFGSLESAKNIDDQPDNVSGGSVKTSSVVTETPSLIFASSILCDLNIRDSTQIDLEKSRENEAFSHMTKDRASSVHFDSTSSDANVKETLGCETGDQRTSSKQLIGLNKPMEKDEFLNEILDCIGDVELVLSQSNFTSSKNLKLEKKQSEKTLPDALSISESKTTNSKDWVPSLSDLAEDTGFAHDWHLLRDDFFSTRAASEDQVDDPLLDHLTDVQRFTESKDDLNLAAIANEGTSPTALDLTTHIVHYEDCCM